MDAKKLFAEANDKSYEWKNYDTNVLMKMSIPFKDDSGTAQTINMDMKMMMTIFMEPYMKAKINSSIVMESMGEELTQPMDMYLSTNDKSYTTYIGTKDNKTGLYNWAKSTIEDETFANLLKYNDAYIKENKELTEKYTKDVKYLGKYNDPSGRTLLKLEYTLSGDIYKDMLSKYSEEMAEISGEEDAEMKEAFEALASGNIGDITYIAYIDEATGEFAKYEMNLGSMMTSIMSGMTEIPAEQLETLKQMKVEMIMDISNINQAKDFEIPKEALDAPEVSETVQ